MPEEKLSLLRFHPRESDGAKRSRPLGLRDSRLHLRPDNRFTDGGEAVSLTRRTCFTPRKNPGTVTLKFSSWQYYASIITNYVFEDYRLAVEKGFARPNVPESCAGGSVSSR
jgi:hypothetical protein